MDMRCLTGKRCGQGIALLGLIAILGIGGATAGAQHKQQFLPAVAGGSPPPAPSCNIPNTTYHSLSIAGPSLTVNPDQDENLNLGYRGYELTDAPRKLVVLGAVFDTKAPQFPGLFADRRTPAFTNTYHRYRWDENCDCPVDTSSRWETTVLGMGVRPGETIYTPDSGHDIGGGYRYMVMYAAETRITLHVGRQDEFHGYVIHIEDVCVDSDLLALYRQLQAGGRRSLPALRGHQPFGTAIGDEIKIAVRDSGSFMDPRSRNDWWQGR